LVEVENLAGGRGEGGRALGLQRLAGLAGKLFRARRVARQGMDERGIGEPDHLRLAGGRALHLQPQILILGGTVEIAGHGAHGRAIEHRGRIKADEILVEMLFGGAEAGRKVQVAQGAELIVDVVGRRRSHFERLGRGLVDPARIGQRQRLDLQRAQMHGQPKGRRGGQGWPVGLRLTRGGDRFIIMAGLDLVERDRLDELHAADVIRFAGERFVAGGEAGGAGKPLRCVGGLVRRCEQAEQGDRAEQPRRGLPGRDIVGQAVATDIGRRRPRRSDRRVDQQGRQRGAGHGNSLHH
jgi:hypothetical protein